MSRRSLATPQQVAEFLALPERTLQQWRYLGTGPTYVKVGRHVRYDWAGIEAWVDSQRQSVGPGAA